MATVGVLCARGRVEEKALMTALAEAGIVSALFPPAEEPLPIGPLPIAPGGRPFPVPQIVVDRHVNRQIARAVLTTCRALDVPLLSAGISATGDRLDVASTLAAHGLPRPATALGTSETAAMASVMALGLPATLLPLDLESRPVQILDIDAAEAVLEHRAVLGGSVGSLGLIQAGSPAADHLVTVIVIDGVATAQNSTRRTRIPGAALRLAEDTARALSADIIAVAILLGAGSAAPIVWDVQPVPEFRQAQPLGDLSVAGAIARLVDRRLGSVLATSIAVDNTPDWSNLVRQGTRRDFVISA
ncbi:MAG: hypothetical protein H0T18_04435 [Chloroflexia bacterium]|nr:hypothetical protein [Chloroflexia bacterium]